MSTTKDNIFNACTATGLHLEPLVSFLLHTTDYSESTLRNTVRALVNEGRLHKDADGKISKPEDFNLVKRFLHTNMTCPRGEALAREFGYGSMARG